MVKVSAERKAEHRAAILDAAAAQLRRDGPEGLRVAAVMEAAGLTHGGFYNHFASKEALIAEALRHALARSARRLARRASAGGLDAFAAGYLSEAHLADVSGGCPFAALACEIPRQPQAVRAAFADGLRGFLAAAEAAGTDDPDASAAEIARWLGALVLARSVAAEDPALARRLLAAGRPPQGRDPNAPEGRGSTAPEGRDPTAAGR